MNATPDPTTIQRRARAAADRLRRSSRQPARSIPADPVAEAHLAEIWRVLGGRPAPRTVTPTDRG
jgi:hypothetical protein